MLKVTNLGKSFNGLRVLDDVSFEYSGSGILGIVGPNGSGKTTLLNIISGNIMPNSGDVLYEGKKVNAWPLHKRASHGMVRTYQDGKVFPCHTPREHLFLIRSIGKNTKRIQDQDIDELLDKVGLIEKANRPASTLSFGQKRRLELAMVMIRSDARLYLFDEPASGVDPGFIEDFKKILRSLTIIGKGIVIIEHDLDLIREISDQLIVLEAGKILAMGTPVEVLQRQDVQDAYLGGMHAS